MDTAKKSLLVFLLITFGASCVFYYLLIAEILMITWFWMWCPGVAALIVARRYYRGQGILGIRRPWQRMTLIGALLPLLYLGVPYGAYWLATGSFAPEANPFFSAPGLMALAIPINVVCALGEEIGWRGFLAPQLTGMMGLPKAALVSGLIWSVWHFPVAIKYSVPQGMPLWLFLLAFTAHMCLQGTAMAVTRLASGSVWPATLFHASHNILDQVLLGPSTAGDGVAYLVGETGILSIALLAVCAVVGVRRWTRRENAGAKQAV